MIAVVRTAITAMTSLTPATDCDCPDRYEVSSCTVALYFSQAFLYIVVEDPTALPSMKSIKLSAGQEFVFVPVRGGVLASYPRLSYVSKREGC